MQDCRLSPSYCDVNAVCVDTKRKIKGIYGGKAYRCACKQGFIGNGITCADAASGMTQISIRAWKRPIENKILNHPYIQLNILLNLMTKAQSKQIRT